MKKERKKALEIISNAMTGDYVMVDGTMVMVDKMSVNYIENAMYEDDKEEFFQISLWAKFALVGGVIAYHKFIFANYDTGINIRPLDNDEQLLFMLKIIDYCGQELARKNDEEKLK